MINSPIINREATLEEVIKKLKIQGTRCLFVINKKNKLIGSFSDGDLRKALLDSYDFKTKIFKYYNKKPIKIFEKNYKSEVVQELFQKNNIDIVPVINSQRKIVRIITLNEFFLKKIKSKFDLIVMAGGKGTRLKPFTNFLPKPMIPVNGKPIIDIIINKFTDFLVGEIYVILNFKGNILKSYLINSFKKKINFLVEKKYLGTVGGLSLINRKVISQNFFLSNCDVVINEDLNKIYDYHLKKNSMLTLIVADQRFKMNYGSCIINKAGLLKEIIEKPENKYYVNTGVYVLNKKILDLINFNKKLDINDLINICKKKNIKINVYLINQSSWVDVGNWKDLNENQRLI
jgi:dTDP-glucose pyrophosphorylase